MSSSKSSAAIVAAVGGNDDLTYEILSRLPSKSVIRFQIACKRWQSLTSTASFKADHARRRSSRAIPDLILVHDDESARTAFSLDGDGGETAAPPTSLLPDPSLSFLDREVAHFMRTPHSDGFSVWSSCNGFLLCVNKAWIGTRFSVRWVFCVCDPTTMEVKKIIPPPTMTIIIGAGLVFDPSISPRYKMVCLGGRSRCSHYSRPAPSEMLELATYSSETGYWEFNCNTSLPLERNRYPLYAEGRGVFWNGMINWVNPEERMNWVNLEERDEDGFLLSFDPQQQLLRRAALPALPHGFHRKILSFKESTGRLLLIEAHSTSRQLSRSTSAELRFNIMEMDRDCSGWSLLYHVDLEAGQTVEILFPEIYVPTRGYKGKWLHLYPLLVVPRGGGLEDKEEDVLLLSLPDKIVSYGLGSKTFQVVCLMVAVEDGWKRHIVRPWDVFPYSYTLLSP